MPLTPAQARSIASLADAVAFDLRLAGLGSGATTSFAASLRALADHQEEVDA